MEIKTPLDTSYLVNSILKENGGFDVHPVIVHDKTRGMKQSFVNTIKFMLVYLLAGFVCVFLHELVHFIVLLLGDVTVDSMTFGFMIGLVHLAEYPDPASHSLLWWFFALLGPLVIVNGGIILIAVLSYTNYGYYSFNIIHLHERMGEIFLKTMSYFSSFIIFLNVLVYPIIYYSYGNAYSLSFMTDFTFAWEMSLLMEPTRGFWFQILILLTGAGLLLLAFIGFLYHRKTRHETTY